MKNVFSKITKDKNNKNGVIPILGWVNPSAYPFWGKADRDKVIPYDELYRRYEEYKNAGFNMVFCMEMPLASGNDDVIKTILEICEKLKLGCLLIDGRSYARELTEDRIKEIKEFVSPYKAFKGLMAYDEPTSSQFITLRNNYKLFKKYFPDKLFYVNMLPNYATNEQLGEKSYEKYVSNFCKKIKLDYISYDHYPFIHFTTGIVNNDKYFKNLSAVRQQAIRNHIPFMVFVETTAFVRYAHIPNINEIFWQVNTSLAYGAKGIQYFTYAMPNDTQESFSGAIIARDGTRTASYDAVLEINAQVKAISDVLIRCNTMGVILTGRAPLNEFDCTITIPEDDLITSYGRLKYVRSGNTITGCFDCEGKEVYYVVNNDFSSNSEVELEFSESVVLNIISKGKAREAIVDRMFRFILNPGEGVLVQIK